MTKSPNIDLAVDRQATTINIVVEFAEVFNFVRGLWNEHMQLLHPDFTRGMVPILLAVAKHQNSDGTTGITATEISQQTGADKTFVSKQLTLLKQFGLIDSCTSELDRRVTYLYLSDLGAERIALVRNIVAVKHSERFSDWSNAEIAAFSELLKRFNASA